jgi:hypothetical protein
VNALSRYNDDERAQIHSIEELHAYHQEKEFSHQTREPIVTVESAISTLKAIVGITEVIELSEEAKKYIQHHEEIRNVGVKEVLSRDHILVFLHNHHFREAASSLVEKNASNEIYFP